METRKELSLEELERATGGKVTQEVMKRAIDGVYFKETCDLCGYNYIYILSTECIALLAVTQIARIQNHIHCSPDTERCCPIADRIVITSSQPAC